MAERRMFAKTIIDSDAFLDMPLSTQALYFHLSMRADDDGFINNPKKIQRMVGAADDDLKLLVAKSFIIPFDSGIVVIKHWKIHNYIQSDRYKPTVYNEEKALLTIKENKAYTIDEACIQDVYNVDTQVRLGKDSLVKDSIEPLKGCGEKKKSTKSKFKEMLADAELSDSLKDKLTEWLEYKTEIKKPYKSETGFKQFLGTVSNYSRKFPDAEIIDAISQSMANGYQGIVWDYLGRKKTKAEPKKPENANNLQALADYWQNEI